METRLRLVGTGSCEQRDRGHSGCEVLGGVLWFLSGGPSESVGVNCRGRTAPWSRVCCLPRDATNQEGPGQPLVGRVAACGAERLRPGLLRAQGAPGWTLQE